MIDFLFNDEDMYSNTTLVKVKWKIRKNTEGEIKNSNTTLVKVKLMVILAGALKKFYSNTTLVKVKSKEFEALINFATSFKYNTC